MALSVSACAPAAEPCDDAIHAVLAPAGLAGIGHEMAVGSGDTWFIPPTTGTWSQDVHWDGNQYFMKLGIWTAQPQSPVVMVVRKDGALGSASSSPTERRIKLSVTPDWYRFSAGTDL